MIILTACRTLMWLFDIFIFGSFMSCRTAVLSLYWLFGFPFPAFPFLFQILFKNDHRCPFHISISAAVPDCKICCWVIIAFMVSERLILIWSLSSHSAPPGNRYSRHCRPLFQSDLPEFLPCESELHRETWQTC